MRILFITDGIYPFVIGGMQKHSYYIAKYLTQQGIQVHLIHCADEFLDDHKGEELLRRSEFSDFVQENITFADYAFPALDKLPGHYTRESKAYSKRIYEDIKDQLHSFDLIYAKGFTAWKFIVEKEKGLIDIPIFVKLHGYEMFQRAPSAKVKAGHLLLRGISSYVSQRADFTFSYGGKITDLIANLGVASDRILETPGGIESKWIKETELSTTKGVRKFVFIGRYERRKGIEELSDSLKKLIQQKQEGFEFHFIGPIPSDKQIKHASLFYHGQLNDQHEIHTILAQCDILVCPSYSEGMPNVIFEAMASGLAVIATDVGAVSEQVGPDNGWLLPRANSDLILDAIKAGINTDDASLLQLKQNSREKIRQKFVWSKVIKQKIQKLTEAVEKFAAEKA